jgi:hypothetical protein
MEQPAAHRAGGMTTMDDPVRTPSDPASSDPAPAPARPTAQAKARSHLSEIVIGGGVLLISLISLFVAINANRTQERMLAASIWPSLLFSTSNVDAQGVSQIGFDLLNRGTGPARVRWAELRYDGAQVANLDALLRRCCASDAAAQLAQAHPFTSGIQNRVVGTDEWVHMLRLPREGTPPALWQAFDRERFKVTLRACYCSVLDDCWIYDSARDDPAPVPRCPAPGKVLWQG